MHSDNSDISTSVCWSVRRVPQEQRSRPVAPAAGREQPAQPRTQGGRKQQPPPVLVCRVYLPPLSTTISKTTCGELVDQASTQVRLLLLVQQQQQHRQQQQEQGSTRSVGRSSWRRRGGSAWLGWRRPGASTRALTARGDAGRTRRPRSAARPRASSRG